MNTKNLKTILFAGLIAAMILPFSGMSMAEAEPNENANENAIDKNDPQEKIKKIKEDKEKFEDEWTNENDQSKKDKIKKYIQRADMFIEIEELLQQEQTSKTQKELSKIYKKLAKSYTADENGLISASSGIKETSTIDSLIPWAYASSGSYNTSTQYRSECSSQYGWSQGTYDADDYGSTFDNTWNYPTVIFDGNCESWDAETYKLTVFGYRIYCFYATSFLTASINCAAEEGDIVTIWSNAHYDGPLNPPAQQTFTQLAGVTTKWL